jgi:DsbC/DsbD-like thiol-disulfide interchange protein
MKKIAALVIALATVVAMAQAPKPEVSLKPAATTAKVNAEVKADVWVTIPDGLHAYQNPPAKDYQIPLKISASDANTKVVKVTYPKGVKGVAGGEESMVYEGKVKVQIVLKAPAAAGKKTFKVKVNYQFCDDSTCFAPSSVEATAAVTVKK